MKNILIPLSLYYNQSPNKQVNIDNLLILKQKKHHFRMNYYYPHYLYMMGLPMIFSNKMLMPIDYHQKPFPSAMEENRKEIAPSLKVEQKQAKYVHTKQELRTPSYTYLPKLKSQNSQGKKTQTDSFTQKRNIAPNNINHILAFVQRKSKSQQIVQKLIKQYEGPSKYTPKRFYCYQAQLKQKLHVHVNKQSLKKLINHLDLHSEIYNAEEQLFYNRICRILICYYLRQVAKITILSSERVKQTNKKDHLKAQRQLLSFMLHFDCSQ